MVFFLVAYSVVDDSAAVLSVTKLLLEPDSNTDREQH